MTAQDARKVPDAIACTVQLACLAHFAQSLQDLGDVGHISCLDRHRQVMHGAIWRRGWASLLACLQPRNSFRPQFVALLHAPSCQVASSMPLELLFPHEGPALQEQFDERGCRRGRLVHGEVERRLMHHRVLVYGVICDVQNEPADIWRPGARRKQQRCVALEVGGAKIEVQDGQFYEELHESKVSSVASAMHRKLSGEIDDAGFCASINEQRAAKHGSIVTSLGSCRRTGIFHRFVSGQAWLLEMEPYGVFKKVT